MTEINLEQNKVEFFRSRLIEALKHRRINLKQNQPTPEESEVTEEFWDGFHAGINECIGIVEAFLVIDDVKALDQADAVSVMCDGINKDAKIGRDNLPYRFDFVSLDEHIIKEHSRIYEAYKHISSSDAPVVRPNAGRVLPVYKSPDAIEFVQENLAINPSSNARYPLCPECKQATIVGFTPPKEPINLDLLGTDAYVDWDRAHIYCCNGQTNCKINTRFKDLTTPIPVTSEITENANVTFIGEPISGKQGFDDVESDTESFILRKGDTYHSPSIESASKGEFIKMEVSPNVTVTEKDGYVVIEGKVGSKIDYNSVFVNPTPPEVFPEVKTYTIKHPGNRDLVLSLPAGATLTDGYHTFEELYAHRNLLFINLVKLLVLECNYLAWCTKADDQWFVLTTCPLDEPCEQISYHIKMDMYEMCIDFADDIPRDFDGHTSDDVLERLKELI